MTKPISGLTGKALDPRPFDDNKIDDSKFKPELTALDIIKLTVKDVGNVVVFPFGPIDTLSPVKPTGKGRTNTTLISPTIVQTDAATPYAAFGAGGVVSVHFEPVAYGITAAATYVVEFDVLTFGSTTLSLSAYAGAGTVSNGGNKTINGQTTLQLVMHGVPNTQQTWAAVQQISGGSWQWFRTRIKYPDIVINPGVLGH
jgi:hypothetical protein